MPSPGEMTVDILMLTFVGCGFIGIVACTSVLLKKCYDKYVLHLPYEPELQMVDFQNLESRYAKATVSVIHDIGQDIDLVEVRVCGSEPDETCIIAEEVITQTP
jgi:hypothetical protein